MRICMRMRCNSVSRVICRTSNICYGFAILIVISRIIVYLLTNGTECFGSMEPIDKYILSSLTLDIIPTFTIL